MLRRRTLTSSNIDGKYQTAVASGDYIYRSTDYGVTSAQAESDATRSWYTVAVNRAVVVN